MICSILGTVRHFTVPAAVAINKCDLNGARRQEIEAFCDAEEFDSGSDSFDTDVTKAMVHAYVVTEVRVRAIRRTGAHLGISSVT